MGKGFFPYSKAILKWLRISALDLHVHYTVNCLTTFSATRACNTMDKQEIIFYQARAQHFYSSNAIALYYSFLIFFGFRRIVLGRTLDVCGFFLAPKTVTTQATEIFSHI